MDEFPELQKTLSRMRMSHSAFARMCGVSPPTVARWCKTNKYPHAVIKLLLREMRACGLSAKPEPPKKWHDGIPKNAVGPTWFARMESIGKVFIPRLKYFQMMDDPLNPYALVRIYPDMPERDPAIWGYSSPYPYHKVTREVLGHARLAVAEVAAKLYGEPFAEAVLAKGYHACQGYELAQQPVLDKYFNILAGMTLQDLRDEFNDGDVLDVPVDTAPELNIDTRTQDQRMWDATPAEYRVGPRPLEDD